ncbi:hypothetical protein O9G_002933 [Rozella allomycis CSF55]|uniref:Uncharacterized protein n=1 Tax=Rozella allomycis (strain CSF55) TaxID=988480 RepID=A0A075ANM6_ROZAC|nr:hypothetical protein O9G_002933 [Rozella allomycis CSF55]|eukprot:EPZ31464.1 hypothetical protein O9G_002933 [Rozella allomycis CSF55]
MKDLGQQNLLEKIRRYKLIKIELGPNSKEPPVKTVITVDDILPHPTVEEQARIAIGVEELGYEEFISDKYFAGDVMIDATDNAAFFDIMNFRRLSRSIFDYLIELSNGFGLLNSKGYQAMLALAAGASLTKNYQGNFFQLGGVAIVNPNGTDFWMIHREEFAGDRPSLRTILETVGFSEEDLNFYTESQSQF